MAKDLWELRKQRGMSVKQLASKAGIKPANMYAYERGEPVRLADLDKLAKALFVDASEIKIRSEPPTKKPQATESTPKRPFKQADQQPPTAEKRPAKPKKQKQVPQAAQPGLVRPGQLDYLQTLWRKVGIEETAVVAELGKPLAELSQSEASQLIKQYIETWKASKEEVGDRPPGTRRKRIHLPESVDAFELNYLQARLEGQEQVAFTLLNDQVLQGQIIGFSPYNITIRQADGQETSINKLALAYYTVEAT